MNTKQKKQRIKELRKIIRNAHKEIYSLAEFGEAGDPKLRLNAKRIIPMVCFCFKVTEKEFYRNVKSRKPHFTICRFCLYYILKNWLKFSYHKIARYASVKHTTIMNGIEKFSNWLDVEVKIRERFNVLRQMYNNEYGTLLKGI